MEILKVENLSKHYAGVRAVNNVSFSVQQGERLFILGPNGAGKTTLINLLNGQLTPTTGKIYFMGKDITNLPTFRRIHMGQARSYQISNLFPRLTVFDSIKLAVQGKKDFRFNIFKSMSSYKELDEEGKVALSAVGLWERKDDEVRNLSHGEQRRLEIALALASKPRLLMLDEPTAGLNTVEGMEMSNLINSLDKDLTLIVIAHDMEFVFSVAKRIIILHLGECVCEGSCDYIRNNQLVKEIYFGSMEGSLSAGS